MPRANRHFIPGQVWHVTQRCHQRDFLFKLLKDRQRWIYWLREAKLRYGITVFNYVVTSNHIHLLLFDNSGQDAIPRAIQLIAGRIAQEYNHRKVRKGAFWEDRYHATAVEAEGHLLRCLVYIDLNMVRAGVVSHPAEWPCGGYGEIQSPKRKGPLIAYDHLAEKAGFKTYEEFRVTHEGWVKEALANNRNDRQSEWTESIAVGSEGFNLGIKEILGVRALGRKVMNCSESSSQLREPIARYLNENDTEMADIGPKNRYFWDIFPTISS